MPVWPKLLLPRQLQFAMLAVPCLSSCKHPVRASLPAALTAA